jgi:hypothetical protein
MVKEDDPLIATSCAVYALVPEAVKIKQLSA